MKLKWFYRVAGIAAGLLFASPSLGAVEFLYKYKAGDKYRIVSTVDEDVYVDRQLRFKAEFFSRIAVEILGVSGETARLGAVFQSAEKAVPVGMSGRNTPARLFHWARDYRSEFDQDKFGRMFVDDQYYMPMVRDVPLFPGRDLKPGDAWSGTGTEVHDFRDNFGIEEPYRIPFSVHYVYLGERTWKGTRYHAFSVSYRIFLEPAPVPGRKFPRRILGSSDQIVYWDNGRGQAAAYEERFRTVIDVSDGQIWEYRGSAQAEVVEAAPMNKEEIARDIARDVGKIPDASVRVSGEGIVISLENIQFAPESAVLLASERPKLDAIAEILARYPDRDILVGGHTALAGTPEGRQSLSLERAEAAADYLLGKNVRSPDRVMVQGYGAEKPLSDNSTEEGMRKNRRVEIIILEN